MTRYRWFIFRTADMLSSRQVVQRLAISLYDEQRGWGFRVDAADDFGVSGVFIQRHTWTEPVILPDGSQTIQERLEYERTRFSIDAQAQLLELVDPPRGLKAFLNQLAACLDFRVEIQAVIFDISLVLSKLKELGVISVKRVAVSRLVLSPHAIATVEVVGTQAVADALASLVGQRQYITDGLEMQALIGVDSAVIKVHGGGTAVLAGRASDQVLVVLRRQASFHHHHT